MIEGLYPKYIVTKADTGEPVDSCFVLRPSKDPAAIKALECYAKYTSNRKLAYDITAWLAGSELNPPLTEEDLETMEGDPIFTTSSGWMPCYGIDPNPGSCHGPRIDCGDGRGYSLMGFNETWEAYRRKPIHMMWEAHDES